MAHKFLPDGLAELRKDEAGSPYRPSNGTEGEYFMSAWCDHCTRYVAGCKILRNSRCYQIEDPNYPKELVIGEDGHPCCKGFEPSKGAE